MRHFILGRAPRRPKRRGWKGQEDGGRTLSEPTDAAAPSRWCCSLADRPAMVMSGSVSNRRSSSARLAKRALRDAGKPAKLAGQQQSVDKVDKMDEVGSRAGRAPNTRQLPCLALSVCGLWWRARSARYRILHQSSAPPAATQIRASGEA